MRFTSVACVCIMQRFDLPMTPCPTLRFWFAFKNVCGTRGEPGRNLVARSCGSQHALHTRSSCNICVERPTQLKIVNTRGMCSHPSSGNVSLRASTHAAMLCNLLPFCCLWSCKLDNTRISLCATLSAAWCQSLLCIIACRVYGRHCAACSDVLPVSSCTGHIFGLSILCQCAVRSPNSRKACSGAFDACIHVPLQFVCRKRGLL